MRYLGCLALIFYCLTANGQQFVHGKILDSNTKEPLPFVNITIRNKNYGTTTGIDGVFNLSVTSADSLYISYVGYEALKIAISVTGMDSIFLKEKSHELNEVEIFAGENPAFRIIRRAIANANQNNPENLSSFSYKAYHKLYATTDGTFDTVREKSSSVKFFEKHHLFINETYSERTFVRSRLDHEKILGNRMSGVKDPFFAVLGNQFQSFSFYEPHISLFDQQFVNPISTGTFNRYDFILEETSVNETDTSYVISFFPQPGKTFNGLKGVISINSNAYAIENVKAQPSDDLSLSIIKIQQKYSRIGQHWFPQESNSEFVLTEQKISEHPIKYVHRTYISDVKINFPNDGVGRESLSLEFARDANLKDERFWDDVRIDSLSAREQNTYHLYDSMPLRTLTILNTFVKAAESFATGKIRVRKFYLPTEHLLRNNAYEGVRFGIGLQTGEDISKIVTLGAYAGYGVIDKALKYGGSLQINLNETRDSYFKLSVVSDILEPGNAYYLKPPPAVSSRQTFRNRIASKMDSVTRVKMQFNFRPLRFAETALFIQRSNHDPTYSYAYLTGAETFFSDFTIAEAGIQFKFVAGEKFSQIRNTRIITAFKYPLVDLLLSRSAQDIFDGDFAFTKAEAKFDYEFPWRGSATTSFQLAAGLLKGNAPYFSLFNGKGTNSGRFDLNSLVVPNYFQTMKAYEFTSDQYVYLFLTHNFGRISSTQSKYFRPELSLIQNIGYSNLTHPERHSIQLQTMKNGFYESGVLLTNLFRFDVNFGYIGIGGGAFYRYGFYSLPNTGDNIVPKINVSFAL